MNITSKDAQVLVQYIFYEKLKLSLTIPLFPQDEHPPIPDSLSPDITDFLRQCFKKVGVLYLIGFLVFLYACTV